MKQQSRTPAAVPITPRNREHQLAGILGRDWFDDHPFKTAWFNALSTTFPLGEKYFIDSVRHYADQVDDPQLQNDISAFCGQEGYHRREHERYNRVVAEKRGYDHDYMQRRLAKGIELSNRMFSPLEQLALTAAFEHLTAIMAEVQLAPDNPMVGSVDPLMKDLWDWHAAEEMEHKAVAFDVFRAMGGDERTRKKALRRAVFFLAMDVGVAMFHMLRRDGRLWNFRMWREGLSWLFRKDSGLLRRIYPAYREYFRVGFHPWDRDSVVLLDHWKSTQPA